jgi:DNA recombination protein RmuC
MDELLVGGALGLIVGFLLAMAFFVWREKSSQAQWIQRENKYFEKLQKYQADLGQAREECATLKQKVENLVQTKEQLQQQFEGVSLRLLEQTGAKLQSQHQERLDAVLSPLHAKMKEFQDRVEKSHLEGVQWHAALTEQLAQLRQLNQTMSQETQNLTKALKGDNKVIGDYGEIILRQLLEASGLTEGVGFTEQGKAMGLKDELGNHQKPDVVLHLPQNRSLVVDSKMSLKSYEAMMSAGSPNERLIAEKEFQRSVKSHIDNLSKKEYHTLWQLGNSPDFVLLFMPIEHAFINAIRPDWGLYTYGWDKKVILVSPTTLLAILKTLESVWKQEDVNKNAMQIAEAAGRLYDKFVGFSEDMLAIGKDMDKAKGSFDGAMAKLIHGKGNLVARVENLRKLGAKTGKMLPKELPDMGE